MQGWAGLSWTGLGWNIADIFSFQTDLMTICQDNLAIIIDCLQSAQLQETFVCKKKSRDLRGRYIHLMSNVILDNYVLEINLSMSNVQMFCFAVLLNKWEKLLAKIQENIQHTEVYESLKSDILSLREDLARVLADTEQEPGQEMEDGAELEIKLQTFRVSVTQ